MRSGPQYERAQLAPHRAGGASIITVVAPRWPPEPATPRKRRVPTAAAVVTVTSCRSASPSSLLLLVMVSAGHPYSLPYGTILRSSRVVMLAVGVIAGVLGTPLDLGQDRAKRGVLHLPCGSGFRLYKSSGWQPAREHRLRLGADRHIVRHGCRAQRCYHPTTQQVPPLSGGIPVPSKRHTGCLTVARRATADYAIAHSTVSCATGALPFGWLAINFAGRI